MRMNYRLLVMFIFGCYLMSCLNAAEEAGEKIIIDEEFKEKSALWTCSGCEINDGGLLIVQKSPKKNNSTLLLFAPEFEMPKDGQIKVSMKLDKFMQIDSESGDINAQARIFISPAALNKWPDAYTLDNAMTIWIKRNGDEDDMSFSLYAKNNRKGMGQLLYKGVFAPEELPLEFTLRITADNYYLRFNRMLDGATGSLSGQHSLPFLSWGKMKTGMRLTSGEDKAVRLQLGKVQVSTDKKPVQ